MKKRFSKNGWFTHREAVGPFMKRKNRYLGSVRFFKHIIVFTVLLALTWSTTVGITLAVQVHEYQSQAEDEPIFEDQYAVETVAPPCTPTPSAEPTRALTVPTYTDDYSELYAPPAAYSTVDIEKMAYLTFDDGPSARTAEILDILDRYGVKGTFFVVGAESEDAKALMRRIVEEGHTLGMHSYTHDYKRVYTSVEDYLADYDQLFRLIQDATGTTPQIMRYPGGSINGYNGAIYIGLIAEMVRRGFVYFDWNVDVGDTTGAGRSTDRLIKNALGGISSLRRAVILMHDSADKNSTVEALPSIIEGYRDAGYTFAALTPEVVPVVFSYPW